MDYRLPVLDLKALEWHKRAACRNHPNPDLWFPERGGNTRAAKAICETCPVREPCLRYALDDPETQGVWGATTFKERREMRRDEAA